MPMAHLYIFSDACATDWLTDGHEDEWHTLVNVVFQSDPVLLSQIEQSVPHSEVLNQDLAFTGLVADLEREMQSGQLKPWKRGEKGYRRKFCRAFASIVTKHRPIVSACSFQERTLRSSKLALLNAYNGKLGGIEGREIGFEEFTDGKGRSQMKHSFVNFSGYHEIQAPANQMLVLLFMSWFVADQYTFFFKDIVLSGRYGFDELGITVVSDRLSGDDDQRPKNELNLRNLIDPDNDHAPIILTRSPMKDIFFGDLLVDNLAGWLNAAMVNPEGEYGALAHDLIGTGIWTGWHQLLDSTTSLRSTPAVNRLAPH